MRTMPQHGILDQFIDYVDQRGLNMFGICVQRHGKLIAFHRWTADEPHPLYSMSKSYASIGVGIAIDEGRFALDDRVISFFPDSLPEKVSEYTAEMTVRDLLTMSCGVSEPVLMNGKQETGAERDWARVFLAARPDKKPGTVFVYDSGCTYMLSRIVARTTGQDLLDYMTPRLFAPLGIENPVWDRCPLGYSLGGSGLRLKTAQSLPFGQMLLQGGLWNGKRIVSTDWVREATAFQIATDNCGFFYDKSLGYGYQFWVAREGAYRASGAYGQGCFVLPHKDAVITYNAHTPDLQAILEGLWDLLIPAL